ncbi:MAG TPA: hypothetical protein VIU61_01820 [Kofleriaceae bacterium]
MTWRHRIIILSAVLSGIAATACGNKKDVRAAKASAYDTDFAVVYSAALDATRELYPNLSEHPGSGAIKTAWHQVAYANTDDEMANQRTMAAGQGLQSQNGIPTRLAHKRRFIRFDVMVAGRRPWRIKVVGHASEWDPGMAQPTELQGAARPHWLDGRVDALQLAIYKRVRKWAVPVKEEAPVEKPEDLMPKTDPTAFKGIPAGAGVLLAKLKDAVSRREYPVIRTLLADDVVWSLGGAPGADTAMAMWQADPETLDVMARFIAGGCAGTDKRVTCPGGEPTLGAYQLVLEPRPDGWRVTSFVKHE